VSSMGAYRHATVNDVKRMQVTEREADLTNVDASVFRRERAVRLEEREEVASADDLSADPVSRCRDVRALKGNEVDVRHRRRHIEHAPLIEQALAEAGLVLDVGATVLLGHKRVMVVVPPRQKDGAERGAMHKGLQGERDRPVLKPVLHANQWPRPPQTEIFP
jgi:hypothetical protein